MGKSEIIQNLSKDIIGLIISFGKWTSVTRNSGISFLPNKLEGGFLM